MRTLKNLFSQLPIFILWALFSYVLWTFIFGFVTDARPEKKVVAFFDVTELKDLDLNVELEKTKDEGIKMIRIHPFSYAMFSQEAITGADFYVIGVKEAPLYEESFTVLNRETAEELLDANSALSGTNESNETDKTNETNETIETTKTVEDRFYLSETGDILGVKIYDKVSDSGPLKTYLTYVQSESGVEDYYLFINKKSLHAKRISGEGDDAAWHVIMNMLKLP